MSPPNDKTKFGVTLINLAPDAHAAVEGNPPFELGLIPQRELLVLLATFASLDAVQNLKLDPEIRIHTKRDRYIVRTGEGKLFLYDARNPSNPAHVCSTPAELIGEIDGTAAALRTVAPFPMDPSSHRDAGIAEDRAAETALPPAAPPPAKPTTLILAVAALILGGYVAYAKFSGGTSAAAPALVALTTAERTAQDAALIGVYMTGTQPGSCGIAVQGDGNVKIFRVNQLAAPSTVYGSYRLGRIDSTLCLATDQPGGLIKVIDIRTLEYVGEKYERIQ